MYWSTGNHDLYFLLNISSSFLGSRNLIKYQDDSKKVSNVSVSLVAFLPVIGHVIFFQLLFLSSGFPSPSKLISLGNSTGNCSSGTG